ncbi:hypothetical protein [Aquimarina addita]
MLLNQNAKVGRVFQKPSATPQLSTLASCNIRIANNCGEELKVTKTNY